MLERDILRAFGTALIEFEETLFHKYLLLSARGSLITRDIFQEHLQDMEKKGYISKAYLHGKVCWKRDIDASELEKEPYDEDIDRHKPILEFVRSKYGQGRKADEGMVSESSKIAEEIVKLMDHLLLTEYAGQAKANETIILHAREMRKALSRSSSKFIEYLEQDAPELLKPMRRLLDAEGEDLLLLSLHLIESRYAAS
ncbi:hypothetical protein EU537_04795 [Candidatus Thorarchaeota archaeon]|nr:MAG: hypothetical protein EU537_04795 [Candidatus Thorarchaeota archaeon]